MCVVFVWPVTLNPLLTYCLDFQEWKLLIKTGSYQKRNLTSGRDSTGWAMVTTWKEWCCLSLTSHLYRRTPWWAGWAHGMGGNSDTHAIGMSVPSVTINLEPWRNTLCLICFHVTAFDVGCALISRDLVTIIPQLAQCVCMTVSLRILGFSIFDLHKWYCPVCLCAPGFIYWSIYLKLSSRL